MAKHLDSTPRYSNRQERRAERALVRKALASREGARRARERIKLGLLQREHFYDRQHGALFELATQIAGVLT